MTKEELKKKIKEVLRKRMTELLGSCQTDEISLDEEGKEAVLFYADEFADALIAAGIRDMSDIRSLADNVMLSVIAHKAEVSSMEQRAKEAEHRAEVAERALKSFSKNIVCEDCPFSQECTLSSKLKAVLYSQECFGEYLRQAEKELAEEGKDD